MACRVVSTATSGLRLAYCAAFGGRPTVRRIRPGSVVLNSMKPLEPAIASILARTAAGSPPSASGWETSGSKRPRRCSNAACTSAKRLSEVIRTWVTENPDSVMALPPSTIDIGQPLLPPSPPGIVIAILVYYDFPSAHGEHARRGDKGRHCHDCEDRGQLTPGGQQDAPQHRAQHRAQAADACGPAHAGCPAARRIACGGHGVDPELAAPGAEPRAEHGVRHEPTPRAH